MSDYATAEDLKRQWEEDDRLERSEVISSLLSSPAGRKFLFYQLGVTKILQNPFTPNALQMSFNCGEMNVGQRFLSDILAVSPEAWALMQKEANDEYRTREQALRDAVGE